MVKSVKYISILSLLSVILFACSKEEERKGCTDPTATNYNVLAEVDDGSCVYIDSSFTVWENGELGYWGDELTGSFMVKDCFTDTPTIFLNPDTTITPPDTIYVTNPPDTIYVPADTTINGDVYLLVNSDFEGKYELIIQLINKQYAFDFKDGYLVFDAKLHPDAYGVWSDFGVIIHGNQLNSGGPHCNLFRQSDPVQLSTSALDTSSFTEIVIPLIDFSNRHIRDIDLVFGVKGNNAPPYTNLLLIDRVRWVTRLEE